LQNSKKEQNEKASVHTGFFPTCLKKRNGRCAARQKGAAAAGLLGERHTETAVNQ
jgi:hypothetical protein